jgi:hypothetical protein
METSKEDDVYQGLPSDSEPVLQEDWENMSSGYCITVPEDTLTISDVTDIGDLVTVDTNIDWSKISINTDNNTYMEGDLIFQPDGEDPVHVLETMREQQLQIEALTDMIGEMVKTKNFDIDWDLSKRVEQKRFIKKLSE